MFRAALRPDLHLDLLEERHAGIVSALVKQDREYLREWLAWADSTNSEDDTRTFIRKALEQFAANTGFSAGLWEQERFAGVITLHRVDWLNRRAEIGYWLGREFQGRGLMTDACRAVTRHALAELELNRVEIRCAVNNSKSKAIPRRLGYAFEGTLREAEHLRGRFLDMEIYAMLRKDFAQACRG